MVYYTLANINPKYRSKRAAIRLLAPARSVDIRQCGVDVILNRIKEDMDVLYNGVEMQTIHGEKTIYGAMVSVCGDTGTAWTCRVWALPTVNTDTVSVLLRKCSHSHMVKSLSC